jgi:hypothetical protein
MSGQQIGTVGWYFEGPEGQVSAYFGGPVGAWLGLAADGCFGGAVDPSVVLGPTIKETPECPASK